MSSVKTPLRIAYFGSPSISADVLQSLFCEKETFQVCAVITNTDTAKGRSRHLSPCPVAAWVLAENAKAVHSHSSMPLLLRPVSLHSEEGNNLAATLIELKIDMYVIFAYGKILPSSLLTVPSRGAINLHASLLPKLRGAAPIQNAILQNFTQTGWTLQYISAKLDSGNIITQNKFAIDENENAGELQQRLLPSGIDLLQTTLHRIAVSNAKYLPSTPQLSSQASYCHKFYKEDAHIQWKNSAQNIHNQIRAYNPKPIAWSYLAKQKLRFYRSRIVRVEKAGDAEFCRQQHWQNASPGMMGARSNSKKEKEIWVRTGDGWLSILEIQLENRPRRLSAEEFLRGFRHNGLTRLS